MDGPDHAYRKELVTSMDKKTAIYTNKFNDYEGTEHIIKHRVTVNWEEDGKAGIKYPDNRSFKVVSTEELEYG